MLNPSGLIGGSNVTAARSALGFIESRGAVRVGEILAPSETTLFAGDRVATNSGQALVQYRQGTRVTLAGETVANFAAARVQLEKGLMTIQTVSNTGMVFAASTLRLEPAVARTAANITFNNSKASVAVSEGTVNVVDPSGTQLASLNAGDARLFEEGSASSDPASAAPSAAPPQGTGTSSSGSSRKWLIGVGVGVVGVSLGIAGLVHANDANSRADNANSQVAALNTQIAAANAQIASLRASASGLAAITAALAAQEAALGRALDQVRLIQQQLAAGQLTPAQAATQLAAVQATIAQIVSAIGTIGGDLTACQSELGSTTSPGAPSRCHL